MAPLLDLETIDNVEAIPQLSQKAELAAHERGKCNSHHNWNVQASHAALRTKNPIRSIMDGLKHDNSNLKTVISLGQGDPTVYGHLRAHDVMLQAVVEAVQAGKSNGYMHSCGILDGRRALAELYSQLLHRAVDPHADVILTTGCNHSIDLSLQALMNPGANVLIPRPGYPVYENFISYMGGEARYYSLDPDQDWEINLEEVEALKDSKTVAMIVCNPGNPSGCVYREKHLKKILRLAERLCIPLIADEVYSEITFGDSHCVPLASLESSVPILTVSSLSKNFLVPGWRLGWIIITDRDNLLRNGRVIEAMNQIVQFCPSPSSVLQAALGKIIRDTPKSFFSGICQELELAAAYCCKRLETIHGVRCPSLPKGAMFIMLEIDPRAYRDLGDDKEWCAALLKEESVVIVPGAAFKSPNFVRCVIALPLPMLQEAWDRVQTFCQRHATDYVA